MPTEQGMIPASLLDASSRRPLPPAALSRAKRASWLLVLALTASWSVAASADEAIPADAAPRWWKGNLHTHTLASCSDRQGGALSGFLQAVSRGKHAILRGDLVFSYRASSACCCFQVSWPRQLS